MKQKIIYPLILALPFLGGCGKQGAFERADLSSLEQGFESRQTIDAVSVSVKQLTAKDREYVFGRKNLTFSPVLLTIENNGKNDLFFDTRRQEFNSMKAEVKDGIPVLSCSLGSVVGVGVGLSTAACVAAPMVSAFEPSGILILYFALPVAVGAGAIVGALIGTIVGAIARAKYTCSVREQRVRRSNFLKKSTYVIKQNSKESILLFFEKNKDPNLLPLSFEVQTEPAQILNFELSTNRASQANEFLYKTV